MPPVHVVGYTGQPVQVCPGYPAPPPRGFVVGPPPRPVVGPPPGPVAGWGPSYAAGPPPSPVGGANNTNGDPNGSGSHNTASRTAGVAAGLDYKLTPDTLLGFALAGGGTGWGLSQGLGGGNSDVFQAGLYGSQQFGR